MYLYINALQIGIKTHFLDKEHKFSYDSIIIKINELTLKTKPQDMNERNEILEEIKQGCDMIVMLHEEGVLGASDHQVDHLNTLNKSFSFYFQNDLFEKALYVVKETIEYLLESFFCFDEEGNAFPKSVIVESIQDIQPE